MKNSSGLAIFPPIKEGVCELAQLILMILLVKTPRLIKE